VYIFAAYRNGLIVRRRPPKITSLPEMCAPVPNTISPNNMPKLKGRPLPILEQGDEKLLRYLRERNGLPSGAAGPTSALFAYLDASIA